MREYPDASQYREHHMHEAARRYAEGLMRAGLKPNDTLIRALSDRAAQSAADSYMWEVNDTLEHNVSLIMRQEKRRMRQIKREGTNLAWKMCPPIALLFGAIAWYQFSQHDLAMGIIYSLGSLAFLVKLILVSLFNR